MSSGANSRPSDTIASIKADTAQAALTHYFGTHCAHIQKTKQPADGMPRAVSP